MINATITGRVGKDPEMRTTTTGKSYATFSVASNNRTKDANGERTTTWLNVKVWGTQAAFVSEYVTKGRMVGCSGGIECRKYTDKEGVQRESWEMNANEVETLDRPRDDGDAPAPRQERKAAASAPAAEEYDPFASED